MKNKLLALTLALLMLVTAFPAGAIGMVAVETADEISTTLEDASAVNATEANETDVDLLSTTESNVIYAENFDDEITSDTAINMTFDYMNWTADNVTLNHRVAEYNGGKAAYRNVTASGWGANALISSANLNKAGIYIFKLDVEIVPGESGTVPTTDFFIGTENLSSKTGEDSYLSKHTFNNDNRKKTVEFSFNLYRNASNKWEAEMLTGGREGETRTWTYTPDSFRTNFNVYSTPSAGMTFYYDNLSIEYIPPRTITYQGTDTIVTVTGTSYTIDTNVTLPDSGSSKFLGWSTTEGATEAMETVDLTKGDVVLYPVWEETVVESDPIKTTGDYAPGLNFLTGTTKAETFNGYTVTDYYGEAGAGFPADTTFISTNKPTRVTESSGNKYAEMAFSGGDWNTARISADALDTDFNRPAYLYYWTYSNRDLHPILRFWGTFGATQGTSNTLRDTSLPRKDTNGDWKIYESNSPAIVYGIDEWNKPNRAEIFWLGYQHSASSAILRWDNLVFVPYYKVTYTGTDTVKYFLSDDVSVNVATGEITGLPTSYAIDSSITLEAQNGYAFVGWSTIDGATEAMTEVALENEDIVLYPVYAQTKEYSFVSAEGDYTFYTVEATPETFTFPTAEDLGVAYEPRFSDGTGIYYSGMSYAGDATEFEVYNSYVIYAENFDDEITSDTAINMTFDYKNWTSTTLGLNHRVGEYNGGKAAYRTFTDFAADQWPGNAFASSLGLNQPGIYTFKLDIAVTGTSIPTTEIYFATENTNTTGNLEMVTLNSSNTTRSVEFSAKLYRNDNNLWEMEMLTGTYAGQTREFKYTPDSIRINYHNLGAMSNVTYHFDNFTIEYVPYAPTAVEKTSFRSGTPSGIRFASYVSDAQKNQASYYGYVVAAKASLGYESNLTLDGVTVTTDGKTFNGTNANGVKVVGAVAYNGDNIDRVFATNGSAFGNEYRGIYDTFFTGVLMGINPEDAVQTSTVFVARPFIKVGDTYYYGDCYEASYNSVVNAAE